jgi:hypothetical protein
MSPSEFKKTETVYHTNLLRWTVVFWSWDIYRYFERFWKMKRCHVLWNITLCNPLTFRRNMSPLISGSKNKPSKKPVWSRHHFFLSYSSTTKMEVIHSSETFVDFQRTKRRYISENETLHSDPESYILWGLYTSDCCKFCLKILKPYRIKFGYFRLEWRAEENVCAL